MKNKFRYYESDYKTNDGLSWRKCLLDDKKNILIYEEYSIIKRIRFYV